MTASHGERERERNAANICQQTKKYTHSYTHEQTAKNMRDTRRERDHQSIDRHRPGQTTLVNKYTSDTRVRKVVMGKE